MHLAANDEMIVNVALHLRRALLGMDGDGERMLADLDDIGDKGDTSASAAQSSEASAQNTSTDSHDKADKTTAALHNPSARSVLLLSDDGNMLQAALKVGVPACKYTLLNQALVDRATALFAPSDMPGAVAVEALWQAAGARAQAVADDTEVHDTLTMPTSNENQQTE